MQKYNFSSKWQNYFATSEKVCIFASGFRRKPRGVMLDSCLRKREKLPMKTQGRYDGSRV